MHGWQGVAQAKFGPPDVLCSPPEHHVIGNVRVVRPAKGRDILYRASSSDRAIYMGASPACSVKCHKGSCCSLIYR